MKIYLFVSFKINLYCSDEIFPDSIQFITEHTHTAVVSVKWCWGRTLITSLAHPGTAPTVVFALL